MTATYSLPQQSAETPASQPSGKVTKIKPKKPDAIKRFRYLLSMTKLRVPLYWVRHRSLGKHDIFLGSYPRSGSTWSRFTLYEILTGQEAGFDAVNSALRGVHRLKRGIPLLPDGGRLLGSHEQYRKDYHRAIFLVRDARDVALSEFSYLKAMGFFRGDFDEFIAGFVGARGRVNGFGPWQRHASSWVDSPIAGTSNFLLVRFEDLRRDPEESFARISDFLGVKTDRAAIRQAIQNNSLNRMREKERRAPQLPTEKDSFVRSGSVQGWRGKLTPEQAQLIEEHAGSVLVRLGYPLSSVPCDSEVMTS